MKLTRLLPLVVLVLAGCTSLRPYRAPQQLVDIPLLPHQQNVEIFLQNETPPDSDYYKVVGLEVFAPYASFNALLTQMKRRAQEAGVDAVLLLDQQEGGVPPNILRGIGIKYRRNLNYVQYHLKLKDVYAYQPNGDTSLVYQARFNLMGDELANPSFPRDTTYEKYVRRYALDYLLHATRGWLFEEEAPGKIVRRVKMNASGSPALNCAYTYNQEGDVSLITLTAPLSAYERQRFKEYISLVYNEQRQVIEKQIFGRENVRKYREVLTYDSLGQLLKLPFTGMGTARRVP